MKELHGCLCEDDAESVASGPREAAGQMNDDGILRRKAREAIEAGSLPERCPDRMWGGPGDGAPCTICGAPVKHDESQLDLEFARDDGAGGSQYHVHVRCFAALESERRNLDPAGGTMLSDDRAQWATAVSVSGRDPRQDGK